MARQSGNPFQSLLTHYGLERFLFRISRSPLKEKFVLKGGLLLMGMGLPMARTTRDIDFLGLGSKDMEAVGASIREIGSITFDDEESRPAVQGEGGSGCPEKVETITIVSHLFSPLV